MKQPKTDGCDIVKGLKELTKLQWSGDVDLNDGSLQEQYETYRKRLEFVKKLGLIIEHCEVTGQLKRILDDISDDLKFIYSGKNSNNKIFIRYNYTVLSVSLSKVISSTKEARGHNTQNNKAIPTQSKLSIIGHQNHPYITTMESCMPSLAALQLITPCHIHFFAPSFQPYLQPIKSILQNSNLGLPKKRT